MFANCCCCSGYYRLTCVALCYVSNLNLRSLILSVIYELSLFAPLKLCCYLSYTECLCCYLRKFIIISVFSVYGYCCFINSCIYLGSGYCYSNIVACNYVCCFCLRCLLLGIVCKVCFCPLDIENSLLYSELCSCCSTSYPGVAATTALT